MATEKKQIGWRFDKALLARLGKIAIDREKSTNRLVEDVLRDWYNRQPESEVYGRVDVPESEED